MPSANFTLSICDVRAVVVEGALYPDLLVVDRLVGIAQVLHPEYMHRTVLRAVVVYWLLALRQEVHHVVELHYVAAVAHCQYSGGTLFALYLGLFALSHYRHLAHLLRQLAQLVLLAQMLLDQHM